MSEVKYTPGPWKLVSNGSPVDPHYWGIQSGSGHFDHYDVLAGFNLVGFIHEPNARLIAAAPELLEALEACLLREDIADGEIGDMIRAAITKAKGLPK